MTPPLARRVGSPVARLLATAAIGALAAVACAADALADVPPPELPASDRTARIALVFGFCYALTVLCEFLVVRACLLPHLAWREPGRGRLLGLVATVNLVTLPLVFGVLYVLGSRDVGAVPAIVAAEAIPFLGEPAMYALGFRRHVRRSHLEAVPPRASVWGASLLANVVSVAAGVTVFLAVDALIG